MRSDRSTTRDSQRSIIRRSRDRIGSVLGAESPRGRVTVTLANWITLFRLAIVPIFWYFILDESMTLRIYATFLFIFGALSDLWDGRLARRYSQITAFGAFMDPLADKLLVLSAYWALLIRENYGIYLIPAFTFVILITLREVGITLLRIWKIGDGSSVVTSIWGKIKTIVQLVALILILLLLNLRDILIDKGLKHELLVSDSFYLFVNILFFICMVSSIISGLLYLRRGSRRSRNL